jgi:hypothetical protein
MGMTVSFEFDTKDEYGYGYEYGYECEYECEYECVYECEYAYVHVREYIGY